jgi:hypothetical protein
MGIPQNKSDADLTLVKTLHYLYDLSGVDYGQALILQCGGTCILGINPTGVVLKIEEITPDGRSIMWTNQLLYIGPLKESLPAVIRLRIYHRTVLQTENPNEERLPWHTS